MIAPMSCARTAAIRLSVVLLVPIAVPRIVAFAAVNATIEPPPLPSGM